jgi:hypothetical protein
MPGIKPGMTDVDILGHDDYIPITRSRGALLEAFFEVERVRLPRRAFRKRASRAVRGTAPPALGPAREELADGRGGHHAAQRKARPGLDKGRDGAPRGAAIRQRIVHLTTGCAFRRSVPLALIARRACPISRKAKCFGEDRGSGRPRRRPNNTGNPACLFSVMPGLVPGIYVFNSRSQTDRAIPGSSCESLAPSRRVASA